MHEWTTSEGCLLGNRRMNRMPNARIKELYEVMKVMDQKVDESVLRWFDHIEGMGNDRIAKRV